MLSKIYSGGLSGLSGYLVSVQVDESGGLPRSIIVGNVSASVREAVERCNVALRNSGVFLPPKRVTINLQPADIRKDGTYFDLPIVTGILRILGITENFPLDAYGIVGEVGLDGQIRPVRGILSIVSEFRKQGLTGAIVPAENVREALVVENMDIIGLSTVRELLKLISTSEHFKSFPRPAPEELSVKETAMLDFSDVQGQSVGIRAALIAAAGKHNLLLSGMAGSGKTMIAKRIPGILPPLTRDESIEISKIYSIAGLLPKDSALLYQRPFRSPHHTITTPALTGGVQGGSVVPGELALSSGGVLFLDELPLFSKSAIEALRQPLEERRVIINRMQGTFTYPADCLMVAAMNPCPCGFYPDRDRCHCTPGKIRAYQRGISRPILERIDICVEASPVTFEQAEGRIPGVSSMELRVKVQKAREIQLKRFREIPGIRYNGEMSIREIHSFCSLGPQESDYMKRIYEKRQMSVRVYHKVLKLARTIADLDDSPEIRMMHLAEAVSYRSFEDRLYGSGDMGGRL